MTKGIFFTISPTERGGVTDQLFQFSCLHALGTSLGYTYYHKPFHSRRSSPSLAEHANVSQKEAAQPATGGSTEHTDVYDFLGFNAFLRSRNTRSFPECFSRVDISIGDRELRSTGALSVPSLHHYIKQKIKTANCDLPILVNLSLSGGGRGFLTLIQNSLRDDTLSRELLTAYHETRTKTPVPSSFVPGAVRILVHVRLGDTAVLRTPWNTFVPLWPPDKIAEFRAPPAKGRIQLSDYWRFLATLSAKLGKIPHSFALFSDGYRRSIDTLRNYRGSLPLAEWQMDLLTAAKDSYDQSEFSIFATLKNCTMFIGEEPEKLHQLLHSCLTSDVVIISPQQRLIPKLLQVYLAPEEMPIIVVLVGSKPNADRKLIPSHASLGLDRSASNFFYLHPDGGNELTQLLDKISKLSLHGKRGMHPVIAD